MAATTKLFLIVVCLLSIQVSCAVRIYGNYTGDILLAAFFPVHRRIGADDDVQVGSSSSVCGEIQEEDGVQAMEAFYYALDKINHDPTLLRGYTLGAVVLDSCDDDTHALEQAVELIRVLMTRDEISDLPYREGCTVNRTIASLDPLRRVVGVVGGRTSSVSGQLASLLKLFSTPQVSYLSTSPDLSNIERFPFFKRTVPSDSYQAKAIVELLREFEWTYVSMIYEDSNYGIKGYGELERAATENGICFAYLKRIDFDEPDWGPADYEGIIKGMTEKDRSKVAVLWADFPRARELFEAAHRLNKTDIIWVGSDGWSGRTLAVEDLGHVVKNAIAVQPLARKLGGFDNHFTSLNYTNIRNPWLREYWEHHFECKWPKSKSSKDHPSDNGKTEDKHHKDVSYNVGGMRECTGKEIIGSENGFKQQLSLHFVSDAAYTFAHALAAMHNHTCGGQDGLCEGMKPSNISGPDLLGYLGQVNFSSASGEHFEFINGVDGPPRYTIMSFENQRNNDSLWVEVGTYMAKSNVIDGELSLHPDFRAKMGRSPPSSCSVPCGPQQARTYVKGDRCCWVCTNCTVWSIVLIYGDEEICVPCPNGMQPNSNFTSCENMVPSFMSHSSPWGIASMCVALVFTIYAAFTTVVFGLYYSTPVVKASGRELSFILLAVIITSYLSTFVFIAKPSPATCSLTRILLGLCYAGIYASILAKASRISRIFNDGAGSPKRARLTSPRSQLLIVGLLLIVEVLVLAVWFAASPPSTKYVFPDRGTRLLVCKGSDDASYLIALIYPFLLMLTCLVYAFKTRKTPDGFNETRLITFTSYTTVVIWLAFITLFFINQYNNEVRITTLWVSLTLNATVALSCLLVPKVYICLFRPEKNTREAVMTRSQSVLSSSSLPNATPDQAGRGQESPDANRRNSRRSSSLANQTWQTGIVNGGVVGISPGSSVDKGSPRKARMRTNSATQTTFDLTFYAPVYEVSEDESSKAKPETPQQEKTTKKTYIWDPEAGYADIDDVTLEFPGSDVPGRGVPTKAQFRRVSIAKLKELPGIDESSSTT